MTYTAEYRARCVTSVEKPASFPSGDAAATVTGVKRRLEQPGDLKFILDTVRFVEEDYEEIMRVVRWAGRT